MTENQDLVLDQLYFVTSYKELKSQTGLAENDLREVLVTLYEKGWLKCLSDPETEIVVSERELQQNCLNYHYLASKQGLMAHNLR